jgi:hypothetical protein
MFVDMLLIIIESSLLVYHLYCRLERLEVQHLLVDRLEKDLHLDRHLVIAESEKASHHIQPLPLGNLDLVMLVVPTVLVVILDLVHLVMGHLLQERPLEMDQVHLHLVKGQVVVLHPEQHRRLDTF